MTSPQQGALLQSRTELTPIILHLPPGSGSGSLSLRYNLAIHENCVGQRRELRLIRCRVNKVLNGPAIIWSTHTRAERDSLRQGPRGAWAVPKMKANCVSSSGGSCCNIPSRDCSAAGGHALLSLFDEAAPASATAPTTSASPADYAEVIIAVSGASRFIF